MTGLPFPRVQCSQTGWQRLAKKYDCIIVFSELVILASEIITKITKITRLLKDN